MNSNDISKKGYRTAFGATALFGGSKYLQL